MGAAGSPLGLPHTVLGQLDSSLRCCEAGLPLWLTRCWVLRGHSGEGRGGAGGGQRPHVDPMEELTAPNFQAGRGMGDAQGLPGSQCVSTLDTPGKGWGLCLQPLSRVVLVQTPWPGPELGHPLGRARLGLTPLSRGPSPRCSLC